MHDTGAQRVLQILDEINTVPRQSLHLEKIHGWLMNWGRERGFDTETDEALNVVIRVPATEGYQGGPTLVLQGHMDMVCEKRPDATHDFQNDPVVSYRDGDWLRARGTSLGADNGVALALFFDLATDPGAEHPPLEILITADEEPGLIGAQKLRPGFITGSVLLNVDSEDEGVFTIGCAGGLDVNFSLPAPRSAVPTAYKAQKIEVGGLEGGHSGIEIHLGKASANAILVRVLRRLLDAVPEARIGELRGGTAHNAISREAEALVALPSDRMAEMEELVSGLETTLRAEYAAVEKNLFIARGEAALPAGGLISPEAAGPLIDALRLIPHGVRAMSADIEGMVDTSMNFAVLRTRDDKIEVIANRRSASMTRGADLSDTLFGLARLAGGNCETGNHYPPWEPEASSEVLNRCRRIWKQLFDGEAEVEVTHAGLECGAIGSIFPGMDMISFGPTIMQPHSPDERMFIPSVGRVRLFFRELLKSYRPS